MTFKTILLFLFPFCAFGQLEVSDYATSSNTEILDQSADNTEQNNLIPYFIAIHPKPTKFSSLYLELGGSGGFGSFNFEWRFKQTERFRWMLRSGISGSYIDANNGAILIFPVMVHAVYSPKTQKHSLDVGLGQTLSITTRGSIFLRTPLSFGYRLEPIDKRLFYRFSYTPIVSNIVDFQWQHWGGVTIGYKLKPRF